MFIVFQQKNKINFSVCWFAIEIKPYHKWSVKWIIFALKEFFFLRLFLQWHSIKQYFCAFAICMYNILYLLCSLEQKRIHGSSAFCIQIFILLPHIIWIYRNEIFYLHGCDHRQCFQIVLSKRNA